MSKEPVFQTLALIGLGLIGSSVARAAKAHGLVGAVVGHAKSAETRETAMGLGYLDRVEADPAAAVADADCVMICTPLSAIPVVTRAFAPALKPGAIVTDVGSVKSAWCAIWRRCCRRVSHSCRATRWPGPSIPARNPASRSCSRAVGAC